MEIFVQLAAIVISAAASFGGAYAAVRAELQYLRRDVDELQRLHKGDNRHMVHE